MPYCPIEEDEHQVFVAFLKREGVRIVDAETGENVEVEWRFKRPTLNATFDVARRKLLIHSKGIPPYRTDGTEGDFTLCIPLTPEPAE